MECPRGRELDVAQAEWFDEGHAARYARRKDARHIGDDNVSGTATRTEYGRTRDTDLQQVVLAKVGEECSILFAKRS